jgi:hypothetical protein
MKALKFFLKALGYTSYAFMLVMTWLFSILAVCLLIVTIVDKEWWGIAAVAASAFVACLCWTIRKDGLV